MIIAISHHEKEVQVKDLTRIDASKSVLVKGSANPINSVKIKAGADASEIEVFNADSKKWFLDWAFAEYAFDVDTTNSKLVFEVGGTKYTTNVPPATYTLANLLTAIKNQIEATASPIAVSFTVDDRNRVKFVPSLPLKFLPNSTSADILPHIGFTKEDTLQGAPIEYGLRKITVTVASTSESATSETYMKVYTEEGDALFAEDADLVGFEGDIMKWLPQGRGSYKDVHRKAQRLILDWSDRQGYRDDNGEKLTKFAFVDNTDVRMWSTYLALKLFFLNANNDVDDVFKKKASYYEKLEVEARNRAVLNLDLDAPEESDGKPDISNQTDQWSGRIFHQ